MKYFFCQKGKPLRNKWLTFGFILIFLILALATGADAKKEDKEIIQLEKIIITPQRQPTQASSQSRSIFVIETEEIEELPVNTPQEVLGYIQSVDLKKRGVGGVQADVSIRGSTFEQVLVLVDGVKMNDPQTAHHNMDIPVTVDDIERIEVLRGGCSSSYGANAFGGVINIITKTPQERETKFQITRGEHNLSSGSLIISLPTKDISSRLSIERRESSGHRPGTDFENLSIYLNSLIDCQYFPLKLQAGFLEKDFGADSFYSNLYPHEEEHTDTRFINLKTTIDKDRLKITPSFYYRRHWDKFILDRTRPWWYVNFHTSYTYGAEIQADVALDNGSLSLGYEAREEKITSTRLGNHTRNNQAIFSLYNLEIDDRAFINAGLRGDYFQDWCWQTSPSVSGGYFITSNFKLRTAINKLFRIPSYTELYYDSPANKGNENLVPEKGWSYEAGFDYIRNNLKFSTISFLRKEKNVIDWARDNESDPWQVENISRLKTRGIEIELILGTPSLREKLFISYFSCGYTYLHATHTQLTTFTKYSPDYLRHQTHAGLSLELPFDIQQSLRLSYEERVNQRHYFLLASRISKRIKKDKFDIELFINADNLLNTSYEKVGGVAMPGRWLEAGFSLEF